MLRKIRPFRLFSVVLALAVVYFAIIGGMATFQRSFVFKRAPGMLDPKAHGLVRGEAVEVSARDGVRLRGWWVPPLNAEAPVYLYFHGNAGNLDRRAERFVAMTSEGAGLLAMSYRGYGGSEGAPEEMLLHDDAAHLYADLASRIAPERLVLFGESLGTGVTLHLARSVKAKAVVLDSPYFSILARGQAAYPWLPVARVMIDTFRSDRWIGAVATPILIVHGDADKVVPVEDSAALAVLAKPGVVTRKVYPGAPHVVPYGMGPIKDVPAFLAGLPPQRAEVSPAALPKQAEPGQAEPGRSEGTPADKGPESKGPESQ